MILPAFSTSKEMTFERSFPPARSTAEGLGTRDVSDDPASLLHVEGDDLREVLPPARSTAEGLGTRDRDLRDLKLVWIDLTIFDTRVFAERLKLFTILWKERRDVSSTAASTSASAVMYIIVQARATPHSSRTATRVRSVLPSILLAAPVCGGY